VQDGWKTLSVWFGSIPSPHCHKDIAFLALLGADQPFSQSLVSAM